MKYASHLLLLTAAAAIVGVGMSHLIASGGRRDKGSLAHWILFELRRSQALEQRAAEIFHAMETKRGIVSDLIAKRLTLREAAEGFRQADEFIEEQPGGLVAAYHRPRSDYHLYRQVFAWTQTELREQPDQAEEVRQRLEKEWGEQSRVADKEGEARDGDRGSFSSRPSPIIPPPTFIAAPASRTGESCRTAADG